MNVVKKFKIRKAQAGDNSNNWLRNTIDKISDGFWRFGDATGMYDEESFDQMFTDLQNFGIIPRNNESGVSQGIVAPGITSMSPSRAIRLPQGVNGSQLDDIIVASKANPAFNEAERLAQQDFQKMFGQGMPVAKRRGRLALKDAFGNDVKYPTKTVSTSVTTSKQPVILKEGVTGRQIQRQKGLSTSVENRAKSAKIRSAEIQEDKAMGIGKRGRKNFNQQRALNGKMSYANQGRPRTRATRDELERLLTGSYKGSSFGKEWNKTMLNEARNGYITPAIKAKREDIFRRFSESLGYYYKKQGGILNARRL